MNGLSFFCQAEGFMEIGLIPKVIVQYLNTNFMFFNVRQGLKFEQRTFQLVQDHLKTLLL